MKRFTHRNDGFTCASCGFLAPKAIKTCRNHCPSCLCSLHVDDNPGDRANMCKGLMKPMKIEVKNGEFVRIWHQCVKCKALKPNKVAEDDEKESLWVLFSKNVA